MTKKEAKTYASLYDVVMLAYDRKKGRWVVDRNSEIGEIK